MKNIKMLVLLFLFIFTNCEKVVEIDVPSTEPKLVIDAAFEVFFNEDPVTAKTVVKLSLSSDYFDEEIPVVTDATVYITNLNDNSIIQFYDINYEGNFTPSTSFIPEDNVMYELTVIYKNETYKGKATKIKSTPLIQVEQGETTLFSEEEETEVKVLFKDDVLSENYYLFDFYHKNTFITVEDTYFNGSEYGFSYFYDDNLELPSTVIIKISGISKDYFTYFTVLINQSGQNSGGPFQTAPSSLLGNIINTTTENNFPLGYFHISETDSYSLDLIEKN